MTTTKTISTLYGVGYEVAANTNVDITDMGVIETFGLDAKYNLNIINNGAVSAVNRPSMYLHDGGNVVNGSFTYTHASAKGQVGIEIVGASGVVTNYGTAQGVNSVYALGDGIVLGAGGRVTNGSTAVRGALVEGFQGILVFGGVATVANFGTILGQAGGAYDAVQFGAGGTVTNGSTGDTTALISGGVGVNIAGGPGSVANFGVIEASVSQGVVLYSGGNVTNGAATDTAASITGDFQGVGLVFSGTVKNFGSITATGAAYTDVGVQLNSGGRVTNGGLTQRGATITGYSGVIVNGPGVVANYGTITGLGATQSEHGVYLTDGGQVFNGSGADRTALIEGAAGVAITGATGYIINSGTILGDGYVFGARLNAGGIVTNGAANNTSSLIVGYSGLLLAGASASNFGVIEGLGNGGVGVNLQDSSYIINGSVADRSAVIEGYIGAYVRTGDAGTITNYGTLLGTGGLSVDFRSSYSLLKVAAGSTFQGAVFGDGSTLELISGVGTLSSVFATGADVTVSGSMATTTFQDFEILDIGAGATFASTGAVNVASGEVLDDAGALTLGGTGKNSIVNAGLIESTDAGALTLAGAVSNTFTGLISANGGTLIVLGAVTGTGHASINTGTLDFASSFTENVTFNGAGVLELAQSQTYTGTITGFSKTSTTKLDLGDIGFVSSTEPTFSGTKTGGVLTVTDGSHTAHINLKGNYLTSTFIASSDGEGGTIVVDPKAKSPVASPLLAPAHQFIAAMASMGGGVGESLTGAAPEASRGMTLLSAPR